MKLFTKLILLVVVASMIMGVVGFCSEPEDPGTITSSIICSEPEDPIPSK
ncbi:MAG: hypothetical protein PHT02_00950 [Tissierellia bacterium]|nr:hypothetical protein [Tissierellia bacterium]